MRRSIILFAVMIAALITMACGITVNIPVDRIVTGPTQTEDILIEPPDAEVIDLTIEFGAGELKIRPAKEGSSSQAALVSGTAKYNVDDLKPEISVEDETVRLTTGELEIKGIPRMSDEVENRWDLELGNFLMRLKINSGAYQGDMDLGGLPIRELEVTDGAADVSLRFSSPNPVEMDRLRYQTGASNVTLSDLANANFTSLVFRSGAGNYKLDFSGELKRDAVASIESGFSQLVIVIPEGMTARINTSGLMNVQTSGDWEIQNDAYLTGNGGPVLTINVDLGAGNLELQIR